MPAELAYLPIENILEYNIQIETEKLINSTILCRTSFGRSAAALLIMSKIIPRYATLRWIPEDSEEISVSERRDIIDADVARDCPVPIKPGDFWFRESRRLEKRAHSVATESAVKRPAKIGSRRLWQMNKETSWTALARDHIGDPNASLLLIDTEPP
jgi:hypothetical protein